MNSNTNQLFRRRPMLATAGVALASTAVLTLIGWWALGATMKWAVWIISWVVSINLVTLVAYGVDKRQAMREDWRIPEATLFLLAFLGGSPGAFLAMRWFRHKTVKGTFLIVFWLIVVLQVVALIWAGKILWIDP